MTKKDAFKFVAVRSFGNFLVLFALYGILATFGPALYYELQLRVIEARGVHFSVEKPQQLGKVTAAPHPVPKAGPSFAQILAGTREQVLVPSDPHFSIAIPKIGATAKIFPNVDPSDPNQFLPILQQGIAHAKGSVFPGMHGNIYLFAHSTDNWWDVGRYNAVFYLLKDLSPGDSITLFFENKTYEYVVDHSVITSPDDLSFIARDHNGSEQLVLQTCWPPGTTWKRLYVIAKPKSI